MGANFQDVLRDVHDPSLHALKTTASLSASTVYVGNPTLYAVVNTTASSGLGTISLLGNVTLTDSKGFIGLATVNIGSSNATLFAVVNTAAAGQASVVIDAGTKQIGSVTVSNPITLNSVVTLSPSVNSIGFATVQVVNIARTITGNVTLSDAKTYIGLTTATIANSITLNSVVTLSPSINSIGFATVQVVNLARTITGNLTLSNAKTYIGLVTATITGNVTLNNSSSNIGSVSVLGGSLALIGNLTLSDSKGFIGLATTVSGAGDRYIGLVTAWSRNAGTAKTLIPLPIGFSTTSVATVAVPTGGNAIFYATQLLLNANATTGVSIKSGATYLTGNASLRVNLNPGGGWVESGSPDSPVYIGLASGAALVVEKNDATTTVSGKVIYFQE